KNSKSLKRCESWASFCLSGCFSNTQYVGVRVRKVRCTAYLLVICRFAPGPEAEQCLERGHGQAPAIVAKDEFIELNCELVTAYAMMGPSQPLLKVANRTVRQRHYRFCSLPQFASQGLAARHVLETRFLQPGETLEAIGIHD